MLVNPCEVADADAMRAHRPLGHQCCSHTHRPIPHGACRSVSSHVCPVYLGLLLQSARFSEDKSMFPLVPKSLLSYRRLSHTVDRSVNTRPPVSAPHSSCISVSRHSTRLNKTYRQWVGCRHSFANFGFWGTIMMSARMRHIRPNQIQGVCVCVCVCASAWHVKVHRVKIQSRSRVVSNGGCQPGGEVSLDMRQVWVLHSSCIFAPQLHLPLDLGAQAGADAVSSRRQLRPLACHPLLDDIKVLPRPHCQGPLVIHNLKQVFMRRHLTRITREHRGHTVDSLHRQHTCNGPALQARVIMSEQLKCGTFDV